MKKLYCISLIILICFFGKAQEESFKNEFYSGVTAHTSGWGANITNSKYLTPTKRQLIEIDLISMRHPKQQKIRAAPREKRFVFGKLNSIYILRAGYGRKSIVAKNYNNKGMEVSFTYSGGISLAGVKPVYLNIFTPFSTQTPVLEKYDPEKHQFDNIYSGGPNFSGFNDLRMIFGGYVRAGFMFDYSPYKNYVRALEVGFVLDYFMSPLPMMAYNENRSLFPNLYLKLMFGRVYR